jgi:hypothetical protein
MISRRGSSRSLLRLGGSHKIDNNSEKRTVESKQQQKSLKKAKYNNEIDGFNYFQDDEYKELLETHGSNSSGNDTSTNDDQSDNTSAGSSRDIDEGFSDDEGDVCRAADEEATYDEIFKDFDLRKMVMRLVKRYELSTASDELQEDTSPLVLDGSDITVG